MPWGALACDTSSVYCGRKPGDFDTNRLDTRRYLPAVEVVYDTLSAADKITLNNKLLNDNDVSHNGVDDTACTPMPYIQGAFSSADQITANNYVITGTGFLSKPGLGPGSVIFASPFKGWSLEAVGRVKTVDSD